MLTQRRRLLSGKQQRWLQERAIIISVSMIISIISVLPNPPACNLAWRISSAVLGFGAAAATPPCVAAVVMEIVAGRVRDFLAGGGCCFQETKNNETEG